MSRKLIRTGNGTAQAQRVHVSPKSLQHSRNETTYTGTRNVDIETNKTPTVCWQQESVGSTFVFSNGKPLYLANTDTSYKGNLNAGYWINDDNTEAVSWTPSFLYYDGQQVAYTSSIKAAAIASGFYVIATGSELLVYNGDKFITSAALTSHQAATFSGTGDYLAVFNRDTRKVTGYRIYISQAGVAAMQTGEFVIDVPDTTVDKARTDQVLGSYTVDTVLYDAALLFFTIKDDEIHIVYEQSQTTTNEVGFHVYAPGTVSDDGSAFFSSNIAVNAINKHNVYNAKTLTLITSEDIDNYSAGTQSYSLLQSGVGIQVTSTTNNASNRYYYDQIDPITGVKIKHTYTSTLIRSSSLVYTGSNSDFTSTVTTATSRAESTDIIADGASARVGVFSTSTSPTTTTEIIHAPSNPWNTYSVICAGLVPGHQSGFVGMRLRLTRGVYISFDGNTCLLQTHNQVDEGNPNYAKAVLAFKNGSFTLVDLQYITDEEWIVPTTIGLL